MSWKGLQKAIHRLPHQVLNRKAEATQDPEFIGLEKKFKTNVHMVERLYKDVQAYRDSIAAAMMHQANMGADLSAIYDPYIGTPAVEGMIQKRVPATAAEATQAVNDAEAALGYCRDEVLPELDRLDLNVTRPLLELLDIGKCIDKTIVKRSHKLIDYDRHRLALAKLNAKQDRSFSDEKQIFKTESAFDTATQDYDYLNTMLKDQLPQYLQLHALFIQPVFENLYQIQARIYGMIYARCYELMNTNTNYFITNDYGIEDGFQYRKSQHDVRAEMENMDLLKSGGKAWLAASGGANNSRLTLKERAELREQEQHAITAPPQYAITAPPPQYVVALYDYQAQADGDLSFQKDDKIELVERTADQNGWWTGKLHGRTGLFPGNYVADR